MTSKNIEIVYRDVNILTEHPRNTELFGDIVHDKAWDDFVDSIASCGILHPLVISSGNVVISGWRRLSAAKQLGEHQVPCTLLQNSEDINSPDVILALIDCNVKQRGGMKYLGAAQQRKIAKVVSDCLKERREVAKTTSDVALKASCPVNIKKEAAEILGTSRDWVFRLDRLNKICPSLLQEVDNDRIPVKAAADILSKLSPAEQESFIATLPHDLTERLSQKQVEERVAQIKNEGAKRLEEKERDLQSARISVERLQRELEAVKTQLSSTTAQGEAGKLREVIQSKENEIALYKERIEAYDQAFTSSPPDMSASVGVDAAALSHLLVQTQQAMELAIDSPTSYASVRSDVNSLMETLKVFLSSVAA